MPGPFPNLPPEQRGTVHRLDHDSVLLRGNPWGDPSRRDVWAYTPPGADLSGATRYPAVLVLAGFAGTGEGMLSRSLTEQSLASRIDHLIAGGCPPFIAVMPDVMTSLGGSQCVDSPAIGPYARYLTDEIVPFVDASLPTSGRWGAVGRSSGGFGALHLAMEAPGRFAAVASHAGDMGFDTCYLGDLTGGLSAIQAAGGPRALVEKFWTKRRPSGAWFGAMNMLCMSAAYSPDLDAPDFPARLPVDWRTGAVDFETFQSWRRFDPVVRVEQASAQEALRALDLLWLDAGSRDEYHLHLGARRLVSRLSALGIDHEYEEFDGGHRGTSYRLDASLPRLAHTLTR